MDNILTPEIITMIIGTIITVCGTLITRYLIPYLSAKYGIEKINKATTMAKIIVEAVEQLYLSAENAGILKKVDAMKYLQELNLGFSEEQLELFIEQAVKKMNEQKKVIEASL